MNGDILVDVQIGLLGSAWCGSLSLTVDPLIENALSFAFDSRDSRNDVARGKVRLIKKLIFNSDEKQNLMAGISRLRGSLVIQPRRVTRVMVNFSTNTAPWHRIMTHTQGILLIRGEYLSTPPTIYF